MRQHRYKARRVARSFPDPQVLGEIKLHKEFLSQPGCVWKGAAAKTDL